MNDRYIVRLNKETYLYDIWDRVLGNRLFCSFKTEDRANEVAKSKNSKFDMANIVGVRSIEYKGPQRNSRNCTYRTPKLAIEVKNKMIIMRYE